MRLLYSEEFNPGDPSILPGLSFDKFSQWAAILSQCAEMPQQDGRVKLPLAAGQQTP
jgi:hypothetical protein